METSKKSRHRLGYRLKSNIRFEHYQLVPVDRISTVESASFLKSLMQEIIGAFQTNITGRAVQSREEVPLQKRSASTRSCRTASPPSTMPASRLLLPSKPPRSLVPPADGRACREHRHWRSHGPAQLVIPALLPFHIHKDTHYAAFSI